MTSLGLGDFETALDFLESEVFQVLGNIPVIAPIIEQAAGAVTVQFVFQGPEEFGTGREGLVEDLVALLREVVERGGPRSPLAVSFREFDEGVADANSGMANGARLVGILIEDSRVEGFFDEGNEFGRVLETEIESEIVKKRRAVGGT